MASLSADALLSAVKSGALDGEALDALRDAIDQRAASAPGSRTASAAASPLEPRSADRHAVEAAARADEGSEWRSSLPQYSRLVLGAAPYLGVTSPLSGAPATTRPHARSPSQPGSARRHSAASAVASALPEWLLEMLRGRRSQLERHFHEWSSAGLATVPLHTLADAVRAECDGLRLSDAELAHVLCATADTIVAPAPGAAPAASPEAKAAAALRSQPIDFGLLARALHSDKVRAPPDIGTRATRGEGTRPRACDLHSHHRGTPACRASHSARPSHRTQARSDSEHIRSGRTSFASPPKMVPTPVPTPGSG